MRSWKLFTIAGIAIRLHPTFLLLLLWIVAVKNLQGWSGPAVAEELLFVVSLFACVVLHELGHAAAAARFGVRTREITLLPIGGIARLDSIPRNPRQELLIACAGPAVNVVLALVMGLFLHPADLAGEPLALPFLARLAAFNVAMAAFNMLPAFPMDGGRVLRAGLALVLDYSRATAIAAGLGQLLAGLLAALGFFGNPFLVLLGLFIWLGASQEVRLMEVHEALHDMPVGRWMVSRVVTLTPEETLRTPLELMLTSFQRDFPVVADGRLAGMLTRSDILRAVLSQGSGVAVGEVMRPAVAVAVEDTLDVAFDRMLAAEVTALPVLGGEQVVGLVTAEKLAELVAVRTAFRAELR